MDTTRKFDLEDRLVEFALQVINIFESLPDVKVCNYLGGQLLRAGTSPALNYAEAQAAESRKDFIHKFKIVLKELRETGVCLKLLHRKSILTDDRLIKESDQPIAIFVKSIKTAETKLNSLGNS